MIKLKMMKNLDCPIVPFVPQNNFVCIKLIFLYKLFQRAGQLGQLGQNGTKNVKKCIEIEWGCSKIYIFVFRRSVKGVKGLRSPKKDFE